MEERVRLCVRCNAVVGWFAGFCEGCGAPQAKQAAAALGPVAAGTAGGEAAAELPGPADSDVDARKLARDLFGRQLRLIHRVREQAEVLGTELATLITAVNGLATSRPDGKARATVDRLSESAVEIEHSWDEAQKAYNRESEAIEDDCREWLEASQIDAYLTAAEQAMVETEYVGLTAAFEALDRDLVTAGSALALGRKQLQSKYFGIPATSSSVPAVLAVASLALFAATYWAPEVAGVIHRSSDDRWVATAPAVLAVLLWAGLARARR